ncbi:MAG: MBL fold metallo-hydrolase [Anaerolineae bacterium]
MPQLTILGSAAAVPDICHDNTYMILKGKASSILIDCGGSPLQRVQRVGVPLKTLEALIVTHHHPDHIYGVPVLFLGLCLYDHPGLHVFGPAESIATILSFMDLLEWESWPTPFPVSFHEVEMMEEYPVIDSAEFEITAAPVRHFIPTIALKVVSKETGRSIVYSSDTEPCESLFRLAQGVDILIHESTGPYPGHSTSAQAGIMAQRCRVKKLVLIHFPVLNVDLEALRQAAQAEFEGAVDLARDFAVYPF